MDKGHGRLERRTLRTTGILTLHGKWPGLAQGFEVTRERTEKGKTTVEVVHGITSLRPEEANAERLLGLARGHWLMENRLHYVRDVTLGEDACRVRKGNAPHVLAALRNAAVHLLSGLASQENGLSRAGASERLAARPDDALGLVGLEPTDPEEDSGPPTPGAGRSRGEGRRRQAAGRATAVGSPACPPTAQGGST